LNRADGLRLLSNAGIPRLRKITKAKLKFRGKGYEFSDISNLLNTYQLWLDDLYPRAKFRDALAMVEKVGHSKRMQVTRRAWLDDTKPNRQGLDPDAQMSGANGNGNAESDVQREQSTMFGADGDRSAEDELDALPAENKTDAATREMTARNNGTQETGDGPDEDELDALLAESASATSAQPSRTQGPFGEDSDDDDFDALMAEQESNDKGHPLAHAHNARGEDHGDDNDFADEEEAMASMGW
jgi:replication fork protection complex subunit Csm3/Swi3